ncbi:MAG: helix-turn-helix domain-containing protein, partial [Lachnospiraceae bacterium]|nr:helix-turn-helix domain-containing protein [Lachnospiraceae bacterium]
MLFSKNLKYLREAAGHTQDELAKVLSLSRSTVSGYERGTRQPDPSKLILISRIYNVTVDSLLKEDYDQIGFIPPSCQIDFIHSPIPNIMEFTESSNYHENSVKTAQQTVVRKKSSDIKTVYQQLSKQDQILLMDIAHRFL